MADFYVGHRDMPASYEKWGKNTAILLLLLAVFLGLAWAFSQKKVSKGVYTSQSIVLEGFLHTQPVPRLRVFNTKDEYGQPIFKSFLLVGKGKTGATATTKAFLHSLADTLQRDSIYMSIKGRLIYHNGKALLELTDGVDAFGTPMPVPDSILAPTSDIDTILDHFNYYQLETTLVGEIVAPKCYLGMMKPGHGKVHQSCAIQCIRAGIPPVLVTDDGENEQYYILCDMNGNPLQESVLKYVAKPVEITARFEPMDDWFVLYLHPTTAITPLQ